MADRKPKPGKSRYRRSPEEMIADLKKQITDLEKRKAEKAIKEDPASREASAAFRALTKAVEKAKDSNNPELKRALSESQRVLADYFESQGLRVPKARKPRARKKR